MTPEPEPIPTEFTPLQILIAEDDDGHAALIRRNLERAGITNPIRRFHDGQEILEYLFGTGTRELSAARMPCLVLLDIRMPRIDGVEVLRRIKADPHRRRIPVIMLTTTDDPREVATCHELGCSNYVVKPVESTKFIEAIRRLGLFLAVVRVPRLESEPAGPQSPQQTV